MAALTAITIKGSTADTTYTAADLNVLARDAVKSQAGQKQARLVSFSVLLNGPSIQLRAEWCTPDGAHFGTATLAI